MHHQICMHEKSLIKLALCCILIGLSVLYFLYTSVELPTNVDLTNYPEKDVEITGEVINLQNREKVTTFMVKHECTSPVVYFDNLEIKNKFVSVKGKVSSYNGQPQLVAEDIHPK